MRVVGGIAEDWFWGFRGGWRWGGGLVVGWWGGCWWVLAVVMTIVTGGNKCSALGIWLGRLIPI